MGESQNCNQAKPQLKHWTVWEGISTSSKGLFLSGFEGTYGPKQLPCVTSSFVRKEYQFAWLRWFFARLPPEHTGAVLTIANHLCPGDGQRTCRIGSYLRNKTQKMSASNNQNFDLWKAIEKDSQNHLCQKYMTILWRSWISTRTACIHHSPKQGATNISTKYWIACPKCVCKRFQIFGAFASKSFRRQSEQPLFGDLNSSVQNWYKTASSWPKPIRIILYYSVSTYSIQYIVYIVKL